MTTFSHFSTFFDQKSFGSLENKAFDEITTEIQNILNKISLIENKKLKKACFIKYYSKMPYF